MSAVSLGLFPGLQNKSQQVFAAGSAHSQNGLAAEKAG